MVNNLWRTARVATSAAECNNHVQSMSDVEDA